MFKKSPIKFLIIAITLNFCYSANYQNFSLLLDFTCATAKDELEKHPEMRTIAMVELENNFPSEFSREVLKCLPVDVAKIIINPHKNNMRNITVNLPKETLLIYIVDENRWINYFYDQFWFFEGFLRKFSVVSHLSKHLIVSKDTTKINETQKIFKNLLNVVQIFEMNGKVIAKSFDMTRNLTTFETFESSQRENLSQILFPDKTKNVNGQTIYVAFMWNIVAYTYESNTYVNCKWTPFIEIIAEKLNVKPIFIKINNEKFQVKIAQNYINKHILKLISEERLDFFLNYGGLKFDLESYNNIDWCFIAPLPEPYSITELILFMPMDKSCWMWLGITIAVSTLIWRISEGHWSFAFGFFSYFMGQGQLVVRIRTNRLTMKILLQLLIFAIFIFSNGYQSLVTSFMLNPVEEQLLKTVDDVLDSDMKIGYYLIRTDVHYEENPKYQKALQGGRIVEFTMDPGWRKKMVEMKVIRDQPCITQKKLTETLGDGKSFRKSYLVQEVAFTVRDDLYTKPFHPLLDKFQELMDRTFEAGLHQAWERFYWEFWKTIFYGKKKERNEKENDILDFGLIAPSLYILVFGFVAALLALFCEIFWKDFMMELSKDYLARKWNEIFGRRRL